MLSMRFGRDSSVDIVTRYRLDGPGIKSRWGEIFPTCPGGSCNRPSLPYNGYLVFTGVKRPERGIDHPPPSSAEVKERAQLYIYSPSGPSCSVLGWTLYFTVTEWDSARNNEWAVYWWMANGKDIKRSKSWMNVRCFPRISLRWLGERTRIPST